MPHCRARTVYCVLAVLLMAMAGVASAQNRSGGPMDRAQSRGPAPRPERVERPQYERPPARAHDRMHDRREDHRELSDAVRRVERRTGGQVLSAERVPFDGRNVNRVKVVDSSGRVRVYMDDPQVAVQPRPEPASDD